MHWTAVEYRRHFNGWAAYTVACSFFSITGLCFWSNFFPQQRASTEDLFDLMSLLLIPAAPALTMALLAEDARTGEVWRVMRVGVGAGTLVLSKFAAALGFLIVLLGCSLSYPISVAALGSIEPGRIIAGYVGLIVEGAAMLAIGLLASSWTHNQLIAFFNGGMICFALWCLSRFAPFLPHEIASLVEWVSTESHFQTFVAGMIDSRHVAYFLSLIAVSLMWATRSLNSRMRGTARSYAAETTLLVAAVIAMNAAGLFYTARLDMTSNDRLSLSATSQRLAASLKDRMEIVAYFSPELPPPHNVTERYVRDLLAQYSDASRGKITLRVVRPFTDEDKQAAEHDGIKRVQDQKLEQYSFSVQEGYRGVAFRYLGDTRAIAQVDDTDGLEYEITRIIKELSGEKVKIGVVAGKNQAPPPNPMQMQMGMPSPQGGVKLNALKAYLPMYEVQEVKADHEISKDLRALLIVQPDQPFTETELRYIDQFVMRGGSLAVFGGGIKVDATGGAPTGSAVDTRLNKLLDKWGVSVQGKLVADAQCGRARMPTNFGIPIAVPYPPVPVVSFEEDQRKHPVLFRLDQTPLPYTSPIVLSDRFDGDEQVKRTVLAQSTKHAWTMEGASIDLKARERWDVPKERKSYVLGVALEGNLPSAFADQMGAARTRTDSAGSVVISAARSEKPVRVLVFGSGYFMRDEFLPQPQSGSREPPASATALAVNALDWIAQEGDLIEIRAKSGPDLSLAVPQDVKEAEVTIRNAIKEQDQEKADKAFKQRKESMAAWDAKKNGYRWANTLGLPLLFALLMVLSRRNAQILDY